MKDKRGSARVEELALCNHSIQSGSSNNQCMLYLGGNYDEGQVICMFLNCFPKICLLVTREKSI